MNCRKKRLEQMFSDDRENLEEEILNLEDDQCLKVRGKVIAKTRINCTLPNYPTTHRVNINKEF
jgi:hypothetical protein